MTLLDTLEDLKLKASAANKELEIAREHSIHCNERYIKAKRIATTAEKLSLVELFTSHHLDLPDVYSRQYLVDGSRVSAVIHHYDGIDFCIGHIIRCEDSTYLHLAELSTAGLLGDTLEIMTITLENLIGSYIRSLVAE